jgi:ABC-2 type transport system permease protein
VTPTTGVTQLRVITAEWIKLRTVRSTPLTLGIAAVTMIGLGSILSWSFANRISSGQATAGAGLVTVPVRGGIVAQLIIGVLGVLVVSGEYSAGTISASLTAVPRRLPVLWAKAAVFGVTVLATMSAASFVAFGIGEAIMHSSRAHKSASLATPGAVRVVTGIGLYLFLVALFAVAVATIVRSTAGSIAVVAGVLLVLPTLTSLLPKDLLGTDISRYLPSNAGAALLQPYRQPDMLAPWIGFAVFGLYVVVTMLVAAYLLRRRDVGSAS